MSELEAQVAAHYRVDQLLARIDAGLREMGVTPDEASVVTLAPVDEFHTAGRLTTLQAIEMSGIAPGMRVLDAGSGIGGTARTLAVECAVEVDGLDLTPGFVEVARVLTERMGLADRARFQVGSVTAMPYDEEAFDAAFSFHVAMNIEDRAAFYDEVARVLKPGARFTMFDVMKGPGDGMRYPAPWAETGATSFLKTPDEMRELLGEAGLAVVAERSLKSFAADFFRKAFANAGDKPPPLGLHLLTGANAGEKFENYAQALGDDQIDPVIMVAQKV